MGGTDSKSGSRPYTGPGRASSSGPRFTAGRRIPRRRAGRWQAFVLWPLVAFAALAAGAAAFFVVAAPVDLVRDHLVAQFKHRTGRDLEIAGTTSLGFWPRFTVTVRDLRPYTGAGWIVALCGDMMTMPGLGKTPAAFAIDIDESGDTVGLF